MRSGRTGIDLLGQGVVVGIGLAGTFDEVVFHQLLFWRHFLDRSYAADMVSDGAFHLFSTGMLAAGLWWTMVSTWRGQGAERSRAWPRFRASVLIGAGGFNLFDGTVNHKLLGLHQVRMDAENLLPYDLAWNGAALAVLLVGLLLLRSAPSPADDPPTRG